MIDKNWTLFLDRDGVLNRRIVDGYVIRWEEFGWIPGVLESLKSLADIFGTLIVVSNQQGVGKGIMTHDQVNEIHANLLKDVDKHGGRIDAIYYSPHLAKERAFMRKPDVGMGLKARKEFPAVRFRKSVMAGDSLSDMLFGRHLGMKTVFLSDNRQDLRKGYKLIDFVFPDLRSFTNSCLSSQSSFPNSSHSGLPASQSSAPTPLSS